MRRTATIALAVLLGPSLLRAAEPLAAPEPDALARAMDNATGYLLKQFSPQGPCRVEYPQGNPRYGGRTLLSVWALVSAGMDYRNEPRLRDALRWCLQAKLHGTYPVALRCAALSALKDPRSLPQLRKDVAWLLQAARPDGAYTYTPAKTNDGPYDNSNTQWAAMGLWAAATHGVDVPGTFWRRLEDHWLAEQQSDGGWGYLCRVRDGQRVARTYGSMTAAGVATLSMCFAQQSRRAILDCRPLQQTRAIRRGTDWLAEHFSARIHPRKNQEYFYHWLLMVQRVGAMTGRKYLAGHDWYAEGAAELLRRQHADGSFSFGNRVEATALAVLFLARGGAPTLLSKLQFDGNWNARPHDAANLAAWLGRTYERPLGWQVIDARSTDADWDDGRIVYLSGAGPVEFDDEPIRRLRRFVLRGGLILSEAACNRAEFTLDLHRHLQRMFPRYRLEPVPDDHPLRSLVFRDVEPDGLMMVSNGIRPLAIHAPKQLSLALEGGATPPNRPVFNQLANLFLMLTDMGSETLRGSATWPAEPPAGNARRELRLARLRHRGNDDPEPLAWERLTRTLKRDQAVDLLVSPPLPAGKLSAKVWPVLHVTGTKPMKLLPRDLRALRQYVADGGLILADAAGGSEAFARSFRSELAEHLGEVVLLPRSSRFYLGGPNVIDSVRYRRGMARELPGDQRRLPRLEAVFTDDRAVVIFSRDDLTAGLVGYPLLGLRGYVPEDARRIMTNLLLQARP